MGIARWLNQHGIAGVVLEYRLPNGKPFVPLLDAQRAIRMVRARAGEWKCNPRRIGIIGFSAGGHQGLDRRHAISTPATPAADDPHGARQFAPGLRHSGLSGDHDGAEGARGIETKSAGTGSFGGPVGVVLE
jgi:hypothetical protein